MKGSREGRQALSALPTAETSPFAAHSSASLKVPSAGGSLAWTPPPKCWSEAQRRLQVDGGQDASPGSVQAQAQGPLSGGEDRQLALHLTSSPERPRLHPLKGTQASVKRACSSGRPRHLQHRALVI